MKRWLDNKYFLYFLIFPFFNPVSLKYIPGLTIVYTAIQGMKVLGIAIIILTYLCRRRISSVIAGIAGFQIFAVMMSVINGVLDTTPLFDMLLFMGISMLTEMAIQENPKLFIKILNNILLVIETVNLISIVAFPNGLPFAILYTSYKNPLYFTGIDNGMIKGLIPFLVTAFLLKDIYRNSEKVKVKRRMNLRLLYTSVISLMILFSVKSSTGILVGIIFIALNLIYTFLFKSKLSNKIMIGTYVWFFIFMVILGSNTEIASTVAGLFGKDGGFTGRSVLWLRAIELIKVRPILGYGYTDGIIDIWGGMLSSHNLFLELAIQGGIFLTVIFIYITLKSFHHVKDSSVAYYNTVFMGIFAYLLAGMMEVGINVNYFLLIVLAFYPNYRKGRFVKVFRY